MGCILFFIFFIQPELNEVKHDNTSSPGISDQEKAIAANALEAFTVTSHLFTINSLRQIVQS